MSLLDDALGIGVLIGGAWALRRHVTAGDGALKAVIAEGERRKAARAAAEAEIAEVLPRFPVASTTGILATRGHRGAPSGGSILTMLPPDLAQGLGVCGPPGSGKTLTVVVPFVRWMSNDAGMGMFVPAVKNDFADLVTAEVTAHRTGAVVHRVGPGFKRWNLMSGLAPDAVAGFIRTVGERKGGGGDSTWTDAATSHAQSCSLLLNALTNAGADAFTVEVPVAGGTDTVQRAYTYDFISLHGLANVGGEEWQAIRVGALAEAAVIRGQGEMDRAEQIEIALEARRLEFDELADRTRSSVLMNINSVLGPLVKNLDLRRTFAGETDVRIDDLSRGAVIVLDIDIDRYRGSAEFLFMLAFEQFSTFALRRMKGAPNHVAFVGDEFQTFASERSVDFFALARQAKIVNLLTIQTMSRLIGKVRNKENAHAILSTLGSTLWFPTSDPETLSYVTQVVGQADVEFETTAVALGRTENTGTNVSHGPSGGGGYSSGGGFSQTETTSTAVQQRAVVDAHLMRTLKSHFPRAGADRAWAEAIGFLRVDGKIVDDVVRTWGPVVD